MSVPRTSGSERRRFPRVIETANLAFTANWEARFKWHHDPRHAGDRPSSAPAHRFSLARAENVTNPNGGTPPHPEAGISAKPEGFPAGAIPAVASA